MSILGAVIALLLGLTIHEFAHAWTANRLGDPTPRWAGRVTLNPLAHLDPIGSIMFLLMVVGWAPIAWGKPVPINPGYMRWGRRGAALATVAGPLSNLLLALLVGLLLRLSLLIGRTAVVDALNNSRGLSILLSSLMIYNVALAAFNLIPLPPLDGFGILEGISPPSWEHFLGGVRRYGLWILLFLLLSGNLLGPLNPVSFLWGNIFRAFWRLVRLVSGLPG